MNKIEFLQIEFPRLLATLNADTKGSWGVLNALQMVEHLTDSFSFATGKNNQVLLSPPERVESMKAFAISDKEFKPNTKNVLMSEMPADTRAPTIEIAIASLKKTISDFILYFEKNKGATLTNPFFGDMNYEEWLALLYKHSVHHCKQFRLLT